jgi:Ca2+/Na+ antiporter
MQERGDGYCDVSIGTIVGSAVFNIRVIPGLYGAHVVGTWLGMPNDYKMWNMKTGDRSGKM